MSTGMTKLTAINVSGTTAVTLGGLSTLPLLSTLTVAGKGALTGTDLSSVIGLKGITSTSSGPVQVTLSQTTTNAQSFTNTGSGMSSVLITAQALAPIAAGTNANNYLIWSAAAPASLTASGGTITGFNTLGTTNASSGTFNMASYGAAFTAIDVITLPNATIGFTAVTPGTAVTLDGGGQITPSTSGLNGSAIASTIPWSPTGVVSITQTGTAGATQAQTINLGVPSTDPRIAGLLASRGTVNGFTTGQITLADASTSPGVSNGVGTVTINSSALVPGSANTVSTLSDVGLTTLNITGTAALVVTTFTTGLASSLTINNTSTSSATSWIGGIPVIGAGSIGNVNLSTLTITGTGPTAIGALTTSSSVLTINDTNTNASTPIIGSITDASLAGLTINNGGMNIVNWATSAAVTGITNNGGATTFGVPSTSTNNYGTAGGIGIAANNITNLTISGNQPVTINGLVGSNTLTVTNSNSSAVSIPYISSLTHTSQTWMNAGSGTMTVGNLINLEPALVTLTLIGNVAYTNNNNTISVTTATAGNTGTVTNTAGLVSTSVINGTGIGANAVLTVASGSTFTYTGAATTTGATVTGTITAPGSTGATALTTVSGASDNANVSLNLGSSAGTVSVALGNGNNTIIENATAQSISATFGTGINTITLGGAVAFSAALPDRVTFGAHSGGQETIRVGTGSTLIAGTALAGFNSALNNNAAPFWIWGADGSVVKPGDTIVFTQNTSTATVPTIAQFSQTPNSTFQGLAATITSAAATITTAGGTASFTANGDTYLIFNILGAGAVSTVVEMTGIHTFSANVGGTTTILT